MTDLDSNEDKLNWIFMAFDQDGGGFIDIKEAFSQGAIYYLIWSSASVKRIFLIFLLDRIGFPGNHRYCDLSF